MASGERLCVMVSGDAVMASGDAVMASGDVLLRVESGDVLWRAAMCYGER